MPDVRDYQSVVDQAEQAARAGDFARADERLREALGLQEASLGVDHPSLASTLNNLAVVSETLGRYDDAERFYRRAYAIASVALPPSDPLVATSRENLKDFCAARELTVEDWPGLDQVDVPPAPVPRPTPAPSVAPAPRPPATAPAVAAPPRPGWAFGAMAALALGAVVTVMIWRGAAPAPPPPALATVAAPAQAPVPPARVDTPAEPAPLTRPSVTPATAPDAAPAMPPAAPAPAAPAPATAARLDDVRLVVADVCASLTTSGAWRCERLGAAPAPGRASFYTRIASPRPLRVEHRWYQGAALRQRVTLSVGASPSAGYRTFSRQTLTAGAWRVELRAADGTVLHEAAFDVR